MKLKRSEVASKDDNQEWLYLLGRKYIRGRKFPPTHALAYRLVDSVCEVLLKRSRKERRAFSSQGLVVVSKLDHIGDLLMITPFLRALKEAQHRSGGRLLLIVGRCNTECAEYLRQKGLCDQVEYLDVLGLARGVSLMSSLVTTFRDGRRILKHLRNNKPCSFVDLRPYSPNGNFLGVISDSACVVGFGTRGLARLLDVEIPYSRMKPIGQLALDAGVQLGIVNRFDGAYLGPWLGHVAPAEAEATLERLQCSDVRYVVVHADSGELARNISANVWEECFKKLHPAKKKCALVFVGARNSASSNIAFRAAQGCGFSCKLLLGQTSFEDLVHLVDRAESVVCVDSLVAHVAMARSVPAFVLMIEGFSDFRSFPAANTLPNVVFADGLDARREQREEAVAKFLSVCGPRKAAA